MSLFGRNKNKNDQYINRQLPEHWKLQIFYYNKNDKSAVVPSRFGAGFALNYAHRTVQIILGAIGLAIIAAIVYLVVA